MVATTVKSARKRLADLVEEVNEGTVSVEIAGKRDSAVLISLARYTALQEATFLLRSPELMDSLRREAARALTVVAGQGADPKNRDAKSTAAKNRDKSTRGSRAQARKKRHKRKK